MGDSNNSPTQKIHYFKPAVLAQIRTTLLFTAII